MKEGNRESRDAEEALEDYRNTFKARAKSKLKRWYIEGNGASALDEVAGGFREEAERIFSGQALDEHLQYVESLVDGAEQAIEESPVDPNDPDVLFTHDPDVSSDDLKRDGERFERALDEQSRGENT